MASTDFTKVLVVKDDRIANLADSIKYGVVKGGQNITSASYSAQSATMTRLTPTRFKFLLKPQLYHVKCYGRTLLLLL